MSPRMKLFLMFFVMWIVFLGIGYGIVYGLIAIGVFPDSSYMILFMGVIIAMLTILNLYTYFRADKMVLKAYKVRLITQAEAPELYDVVHDIALRADLPMPRLGIIPLEQPNAFATGRDPDHAVVCVTEGLLHLLTKDELRGVLAHEMAHVKDRDILVMTVAATVAMIISIVARMVIFQSMFGSRRQGNEGMILLLIAAITAPIAAILVQLAISRSREYKADRVGAITIQDPLALANALRKLDKGVKRHPIKSRSASPAHSSLFIVNPFTGRGFVRLFSTHPPLKERIKRLEALYESGAQYDLVA